MDKIICDNYVAILKNELIASFGCTEPIVIAYASAKAREVLGEDVVNKTIPLILCAEEDVQGDHGATIGELDEDTLFYFAARGIDPVTAENILTREKLSRLADSVGRDDMKLLAQNAIEEVL